MFSPCHLIKRDRIADPQHKLTQLLRLPKGEAHHAIEGCAIIGGEKGYDRARKILECCFGDKNKVSCCIMNHLTHSSPIKTGHDLQESSGRFGDCRSFI